MFEELREDIIEAQKEIDNVIIKLISKYGDCIHFTPSFYEKDTVSFEEALTGHKYRSLIQAALKNI